MKYRLTVAKLVCGEIEAADHSSDDLAALEATWTRLSGSSFSGTFWRKQGKRKEKCFRLNLN